jgi:electron transfer flavoprotein beta subunit
VSFFSAGHSLTFWFVLRREEGMRLYVCVKHVPDSAATIVVKNGNGFDESVKCVMNPYDEFAVEEAVRVKEQNGNSEVVAVTLGREAAMETLRSALAMGADRGILIKAAERPDSLVTARALKEAILQDGMPDIVFTGKQSIDSEGMQTMYRVAAELNMPVANNVVAFSVAEGRVTVEREVEGGAREVLEMSLPCVVGAGKGLNIPRYPKFSDIMKARRKQVKQLDLVSLGFKKPHSGVEILELRLALEKRRRMILQGQPGEVVQQLAQLLREEEQLF